MIVDHNIFLFVQGLLKLFLSVDAYVLVMLQVTLLFVFVIMQILFNVGWKLILQFHYQWWNTYKLLSNWIFFWYYYMLIIKILCINQLFQSIKFTFFNMFFFLTLTCVYLKYLFVVLNKTLLFDRIYLTISSKFSLFLFLIFWKFFKASLRIFSYLFFVFFPESYFLVNLIASILFIIILYKKKHFCLHFFKF